MQVLFQAEPWAGAAGCCVPAADEAHHWGVCHTAAPHGGVKTALRDTFKTRCQSKQRYALCCENSLRARRFLPSLTPESVALPRRNAQYYTQRSTHSARAPPAGHVYLCYLCSFHHAVSQFIDLEVSIMTL